MEPLIFVLVSGLVARLSAPAIRTLFANLNFTDQQNWRKTNFQPIPLAGGTLLFVLVPAISMIFSYLSSFSILNLNVLFLWICAIIIFTLGLIDDIYDVRASLKLIVQIVVATIMIISTDLHLESFQGLFNLYNIPSNFSLLLTGLVYLVFINMFNLIDGVDGLSSGIGIVATLFTASLAIYFNLGDLIIISCVFLGVLIVFYRWNHYELEKKMYLGDNGSMLLGLLMTYFLLSVLNQSNGIDNTWKDSFLKVNPVFFMTLFSYPLLDLIRVFTLRVVSGESPFKADRRHVHHRLSDLGLSHLQISLIVMAYTVFASVIAIILTPILSINSLFLCLGLFTALVVYSPFIFLFKIKSSPHD